MARSKTPGAAQLTLLLFIISCVLSRASCFNIFSHFFSRTHIRDAEDEVNPFSAVQHVPEAPTPPPPSLLDKTLVFGPTGLPPANETCFNGTEAPDPRAQNILIALEAYCPGAYDTEKEAYCSHPVRAFHSRCLIAKLPIDDKRIRMFHSAEMKSKKSTPKGTYKAAYTGFMRRLAPIMEAKGWSNYHWSTYNNTKFWKKALNADIIILSILNFRNVVRVLPNKRYILVQTNDGATLSFALGCDLDDPRILGVLQHTSLSDLHENNMVVLESRRHFSWLTPDNPAEKYRIRFPSLTKTALTKIHAAIPQIYRWRYPLDCGGNRAFASMIPAFKKPIAEWVKPFYTRKYDISFLGTITDNGSRNVGGINEHRRAAISAIERLQRKYPELSIFLPHHTQTLGHLPYPHFLSVMQDTRFFVSPFGLGEFSGKDYEAMLTGALLIKPWAHKLRAYPNIYNDTFTISCDLNFKDLEDKVMPYLGTCKGSGADACRRRHREAEQWPVSNLEALRRFMNLQDLADDWDQLLFGMASKPANFTCGRCMQPQKWMYNRNAMLLPNQVIEVKARVLQKELPPVQELNALRKQQERYHGGLLGVVSFAGGEDASEEDSEGTMVEGAPSEGDEVEGTL